MKLDPVPDIIDFLTRVVDDNLRCILQSGEANGIEVEVRYISEIQMEKKLERELK